MTTPLAPDLLAILRCPRCKGNLRFITQDTPVLECPACRLHYPVRDGIPIMLLDEAVPF